MFRILLVCGLALLMTAGRGALAQDAQVISQITFEANAEGFVIPAELPDGIIQIAFENNSEALTQPFLARLNEGVTLDDLEEAISQDGEEAAIRLVSLLGGPLVAPQTVVDVTYDLTPGTHLLVDNGREVPSLQPFVVTDSDADDAAPPEADVEISLVDFAFNTPIAIAAGPQVWHIVNQGAQNHHMFIIPLEESITAGEFNQFLMEAVAGEAPDGPEPIIEWFAMSPGEQAWITYDLAPGTYSVVCVLPDVSGSGYIHAELGMRQILTVGE